MCLNGGIKEINIPHLSQQKSGLEQTKDQHVNGSTVSELITEYDQLKVGDEVDLSRRTDGCHCHTQVQQAKGGIEGGAVNEILSVRLYLNCYKL